VRHKNLVQILEELASHSCRLFNANELGQPHGRGFSGLQITCLLKGKSYIFAICEAPRNCWTPLIQNIKSIQARLKEALLRIH
jgi:hypothetical protein